MPDSTQKNIVYVVLGIYPCFTGGMEIFYSKLLPEIAQKENVVLITKCNKIKDENFKILTIPDKFLRIPGTGKLASILFTAVELVKLKKDIKVVHLPYTSNAGRWGTVFPLLKWLFGIHYLLHIHGGGMKEWKKLGADKALFHSASKIISVSDVTKTEYEKRTGRTVEVVLPLVPFKKVFENKEKIRKKLRLNSKEKVLLFVGSLKGLKGPGVLLDAFVLLGRKFIVEKRLKLIFVGDGPLLSKLRERARESGLCEHIVFTGLVDYDEIPFFYRTADIYIITSHFEGTSKSLLEAMFNGLPIIATNVTGINNILTHNVDALLFEKDDVSQLKERIEWMLNDKNRAKALSEGALKKYDESYAFKNTKKLLFRIYDGF